MPLGGAGDLVRKVISRVIIGVTPFRVLITRLITYLLSPLPLQAGFSGSPLPLQAGFSGSVQGSLRVPLKDLYGFRV